MASWVALAWYLDVESQTRVRFLPRPQPEGVSDSTHVSQYNTHPDKSAQHELRNVSRQPGAMGHGRSDG